MDGDGDEEQEEEGVDASGALEVDGDDLGDGLELLVTLLDEGLVLVDLEDIEGAVSVGRKVSDQRKQQLSTW